jgi:hypothetical protein
MYKELMLRFVQCLLQIVGDKRFRGLLIEFVKKKFIPLDESYNMIFNYMEKTLKRNGGGKEREVREALAILSKKQGESERAIDFYIQVLIDLS